MRSLSTREPAQFDLDESFGRLDGSHRFKEANPGAFVDYGVRKRHGGRVFYFNFDLARQMGLLPPRENQSDVDELTPELCRVILETFALVIINEWDLENGSRFSAKDIKPGKYMATRYLQLQHPSRVGKTSGDGRGIWNGELTHRGVTWDVMSSGTGATCLSPATAREGRYFKSGDPKVCYGNGYNSIDDGLPAALMSEIFHKEGISTERTLALIAFPGGSSINVRAGRNLLRPSHLFWHLKQGNHESLSRAVHYCIERDRRNGRLSVPREWHGQERETVGAFCEQVAWDFAIAAARYRSDYIFCWMDWDGDNILCDGGIIDYGSIRKFGGYHSGYRYDDGDRYSTRIGEQRGRARYIVQTFAQIRDFLKTGKKRPIADFAGDSLVVLFDQKFEQESARLLLWRAGLSSSQIEDWLKVPSRRSSTLSRWIRNFQKLEKKQCARGVHKVADGETSHAVYVMNRFLREYGALWEGSPEWVGGVRLSELCRSEFATQRDFKNSNTLGAQWQALEHAYRRLAQETSPGTPIKVLLREWRMRASVRNAPIPVTGNGVLGVMEVLLKAPRAQVQGAISELLAHFGRNPEAVNPRRSPLVDRALRELEKYREGL
jgi:uncharacterized protein YdiU (UPF0061 family)